jgi:hypothetical protein
MGGVSPSIQCAIIADFGKTLDFSAFIIYNFIILFYLKRRYNMKKARFIGVLMAAVMAAVPFTANTVKNFNIGFNSIEAIAFNGNLLEDDAYFPYGFRVDEANKQGIVIPSWFAHIYLTSSGQTIYSDSSYLTFDNGILTIEKHIGQKDLTRTRCYNTFYFNTGGDRLAFQLDGNLVAYDSKTGRPTAQTRTASMYQSTNQGYAYEYVLTPDGRLLIYRFYPGYSYGKNFTLKGKYQIIWDSSKDKMYRI